MARRDNSPQIVSAITLDALWSNPHKSPEEVIVECGIQELAGVDLDEGDDSAILESEILDHPGIKNLVRAYLRLRSDNPSERRRTLARRAICSKLIGRLGVFYENNLSGQDQSGPNWLANEWHDETMGILALSGSMRFEAIEAVRAVKGMSRMAIVGCVTSLPESYTRNFLSLANDLGASPRWFWPLLNSTSSQTIKAFARSEGRDKLNIVIGSASTDIDFFKQGDVALLIGNRTYAHDDIPNLVAIYPDNELDHTGTYRIESSGGIEVVDQFNLEERIKLALNESLAARV